MWVNKAVYRALLRELAEQRREVRALREAVELERHENRLAERHWSNSLLRAKQSYPLTEKPAEPPKPATRLKPQIDQGELEALQREAIRHGLDPSEALRVLEQEKGIS